MSAVKELAHLQVKSHVFIRNTGAKLSLHALSDRWTNRYTEGDSEISSNLPGNERYVYGTKVYSKYGFELDYRSKKKIYRVCNEYLMFFI